jgi:hypothetical protein
MEPQGALLAGVDFIEGCQSSKSVPRELSLAPQYYTSELAEEFAAIGSRPINLQGV